MNAFAGSIDRPNSYIGRSVSRPNAKRLLEGRGRYVTDLVLPRMLHAAFVRSPYAHGKIVSIDIEEAKALSGVRAVFTGEDLASICAPWTGTLEHFTNMKSPPQVPLPLEKVMWSGQPVVLIVADSRAIAEDAAELVIVDIEELPALADPVEAMSAAAMSQELADNICFATKLDSGGVEEAFDAADTTVEQSFIFGRHTAVTLEPRAIVADYDPSENRLTAHHATQTPYQFQDVYSRHYGIPEANVRVIAPDIGGSFGMKLHVYHEEMAVVGASILLGRPIKYVADRMESFVSDIHARDHRITGRLALDRDGRITAMDVDDVTAIGAFSSYPRTSAVEGNQVIRLMGAPYDFSSYRANLSVVFQNKVQTSQYRAVGHPIACAVTESLVDAAARELSLDPFEIRERNLIPDSSYPRTSPTGYQFEKLSHQVCLARLKSIMNYDDLRAEQAGLRQKGILRGIGIALFVEITNPSPAFYGVGGARISAQDGAILKLTPSGEVHCSISVTEQGQGTETIIGQIVADQLGIDREKVRVMTGDTDTTPHGGATWACRGAGIGGETALQAARKLKANLLAVAGLILQAQPGELDIRAEWIVEAVTGQQRISLAEVARIAFFRSDTLPPETQAQLSVVHHYAPQGYPFAFTNGAQGCLVEVDAETGFVKLLKHWVVEDCGRIINPLLVDEQVRGGVVQGLGAAFFEECLYNEEGQLTNGSLADYLVPMACEMPDIEISHVETPTRDTELGAKGCGEAGTAAASAAAMNAVNDALVGHGAVLTQIPMTPTRILKALGTI
ncbi:xanthine dehydrogenase family protein molybdopterin-binding subunit [Neorhizobium galegae]|uniref:xanthine dehydrogenase family protein molybdopterin-binding subunit n=1 Tax=Neorhizobium galegae TaxID=399 RepID=UPI0021015380|nr:xanthine dehydrogenase family protein molybdopterin-binding subunit [Neorhizobium galegae]MCQ1570344.1 xanthine dehydrogenase family protein molybdopterin-binding subunit [Neorhizobium galegae]MCQ1838385.1 xanthine dehydrogenase family protein molybdopterin-binding subunit [Neorhizobium galegae]